MAAKVTFAFVSILLSQMISGRYISRASGSILSSPIAAPCGASTWGAWSPSAADSWLSRPSRFGFGINNFAASNGGILEVFSSSPIPASGISVYSENAIEGRLAVSGKLPFLGTVAVDGALPTYGSGSVAYDAGNGNVAITRESGW